MLKNDADSKTRGSRVSRRRALGWLAVVVPAAGAAGLSACDSSTGTGPDGQDAGTTDGTVPAVDGQPMGPDASAPDGAVCETTGGDALGPFWEEGAPLRTVLAEANEPGDRTFVMGTVYGPDCETPVVDAVVDVWHADADGNYHAAGQQYRLRGQMRTDAQGRFAFESIRPGHYSGRPRHYHFNLSAPGHAPLTTQLYFSGDPFLGPADSCQQPTCNSHDPQRIVAFETQAGPQGATQYHGTFDIILAAS